MRAMERHRGTTIISVKEIVDYICKPDREAQRACFECVITPQHSLKVEVQPTASFRLRLFS